MNKVFAILLCSALSSALYAKEAEVKQPISVDAAYRAGNKLIHAVFSKKYPEAAKKTDLRIRRGHDGMYDDIYAVAHYSENSEESQIQVHEGFLTIIESWGEFATLIGHEFCHIALRHDMKKGNSIQGQIDADACMITLFNSDPNAACAWARVLDRYYESYDYVGIPEHVERGKFLENTCHSGNPPK